MNDENELLEPLATEAGQEAIVRAIRDISSLEYAVRAEQAASLASAKAGEASQSAIEASEAEDNAKDWATKTDTYVEQETITIPPEQEGEEPTTETINLYSARYYAALALDIYNNMSFDSVPTENSTNMVNSGVVYSALDLKADKSTTYTKTEVDTALSNVQSTLTFDNVPTANSDNPVKSSGIKTALDSKQDTLTFDSTPTANSTNPVTSGGVYTALQNVDIEIDDEITEDSDNPVTSAAIWEALLNFTPSGGGDVGNRDFVITGDIGSPLIPTLSSNVGSNGEAYIGGASGNYGTNAYNAFDGNISTYTYYTAEGLIGGYVGYRFNNPVIIGYIGYIIHGYNQSGIECNIQILDENDNWITLESFNSCGDGWDRYLSDEKFIKLPILTKIKEIRAISGVKYQGQNTIVRKLLVYSATNNGRVLSEQMYSNVLYENSSGWSSGSITLSDSLENYDFIQFIHGEPNYPLLRYSTIHDKNEFQDYIRNNNNIVLLGNGTNYFMFTPYSNTLLNFVSNRVNVVYRIVGYKMAKGGYSGIVSDARMTVKSGFLDLSNGLSGNARYNYNIAFDSPMPDNNYVVMTEDVGFANNYNNTDVTICDKTNSGFTLTIYLNGNRPATSDTGVSWIAIRPNSYTREGMVEDVLFSNASGVSSGIINLSGNISDYDLIKFTVSRLDTGNDHSWSNCYFSSSELPNLTSPTGADFYIGLYGYGTDYIHASYVNDNAIRIDARNYYRIMKITGIKFGRYVSGVAVDTTVTQNSSNVITSGAVYTALQNYTPSGGGSGGTTYTAGDGIDITNDEISLETASANSIGGIKVGTGLSIDANGVLSASGGNSFTDAFYLSAHSLTPSFSIGLNGVGYYTQVANLLLSTTMSSFNYYDWVKTNEVPAIAGIANINNAAYGILISVYKNGVSSKAKKQSSPYTIYEVDSMGLIIDTLNNATWYYSGVDILNGISNVDTTKNAPIISGTYQTILDAATALLSQSQPIVQDTPVRQELFSPINLVITSGNTIPSTTDGEIVKTLITYSRPIQISGETYYFVKLDNGTYYYENPNNTIEIDNQWEVTITAKSSGGGSSVTVDSSITQNSTNPVESAAIYTALANKGDVTTNTDQNITGTKTFVGSKKVGFKQSTANDKLGFTLFGNTGTERGYLEFNPTNTVDGVTGLMTLGNYATSAAGLTQVGFRRYSNISGASGAYNLLMPMVADARTPFSLTTTYQNFYLPLGFTDGTTTVKTAKSGLVDLSPLLASLEARIAALEGN